MISVYNDLVNYEGDNFEDYLTTLELNEIFKGLIEIFKDKSALKQAIRYIVWCYSKQSEFVILGDDWLVNKKRIFDKSFLHIDYYEDMVLLKNRIVVNTIQKWVAFQDNSVYENLCSLKDLMIEMRLSCNSKITKSDGASVDYDQKFKNAGYVRDLQKMIDDLEQELIQNDMKLSEGIKEVKKAAKKNSFISVEKYAV